MSELNITQVALPNPEDLYNKGKVEVSNLRTLKVGSGARIFLVDQEAIKIGSSVKDDAPALINYDGTVRFKAPNGDVLINTGDTSGDFIQVINNALNTSSQTILKDFTFESTDFSGAFKSGNVTWNAATGLPTGGSGFLINNKGILGISSGVAKVSILNDGNITIAGDLIASGITADNITAGTLSASRISAGSIDATKLNVTTLSAITANCGTLTAGTITGTSIKATSDTTGANVFLDPNNRRISFLYNNVEKGFIYVNNLGQVFVDGDDMVIVKSDGSGDQIQVYSGNGVAFFGATNGGQVQVLSESSGGQLVFGSRGDIFNTRADDYNFYYNSDSDGSQIRWREGTSTSADTKMRLDDAGKLFVEDGVQTGGEDFAEMFESVEEFSLEKIPVGTSVVLVEDKIRPAMEGEIPFGVVSCTPTIIGNLGGSDADTSWGKKYLRNSKNEFLYEYADFWTIEGEKLKEHLNKRDNNGHRGKIVQGSGICSSGWADRVTPPEGAMIIKKKRKKINPYYRDDLEWVPRKNRDEWNIVGLIGRVRINKGQPVSHNWIKLKDISDSVEEWLIK